MRVLIIGLGGISRNFRNWPERTLGQALVHAGHQVDAITYHQPDQPHLGLSERREQIDGIDVWRVRPQLYPSQDLLAALAQIPRPDIVHILHPRNVLAYQAVRWLKQRGIAVVWTWLGPYHDRWLVPDRERPYEQPPHPEKLIFSRKQLMRRILRDGMLRDHLRNYAIHQPLLVADGLLPCSHHEAEVLASLGFGERPTEVVPLWLDMAFMDSEVPPIDLPFTRPIIPYIGQLTVRKCFDLVVAAMPTIVARYPEASFVFVTHNQEQRASLQHMAQERGVMANLHFLGTISEEKKLALLRASDLLPFPSRYEGFGLPILEAMAAGTPVISTNIPVVNELITDGVDGVLIPYDDAAALASAIVRVLEQPQLRASLVAGGMHTIQTRFHPARLVAQVVAFYARIRESAIQHSS